MPFLTQHDRTIPTGVFSSKVFSGAKLTTQNKNLITPKKKILPTRHSLFTNVKFSQPI